jgi:hypothetical protein
VGRHRLAAVPSNTADPTFGDAYVTFIEGGGALGYGAASLVALTPALILHSLCRDYDHD